MTTSASNICAVVVTFHPDQHALNNVRQILPQVGHVVVVDNGSTDAQLEPFREAAKALGFELLENGRNLGIAAALNRGIAWAEKREHKFVLLLDQDSSPTAGFVAELISKY